jgi:hypothetical protein
VYILVIFYRQVYILLANWILIISTIIVTAVFNNISHNKFLTKYNL